MPAILQGFAAGLPRIRISSASNGEVQRDASARRCPAAGLSCGQFLRIRLHMSIQALGTKLSGQSYPSADSMKLRSSVAVTAMLAAHPTAAQDPAPGRTLQER